jgi:RND family efflux transporter MFP subunit
MRKITIYYFVFLLFSVSCNRNNESKNDLEKRKAELLKELEEINRKLSVSDTAQNKSAPTLQLALVPLEKKNFKTWIWVQGKVDAEESASVSSEIPGMITQIYVTPGQSVTKGQVLAETDHRVLSQQLEDLKTNAVLVQQLYEKQKALWEDKIGTEVQYLQAKTQKESIEKKIATLQEQIRMTKILAPISGVVDAVDIKVGQMVSPGMPAIRIINLNKLKIKAELAESYAGKIKDGAEVIIKPADSPDSIISKVGYVQKTIHPVSRSFMVEIPVSDEKKYFPNQTMMIKINEYTSAQPVFAVPSEYIFRDEKSGHYVWIAENGMAKKIAVTTGKTYGGISEIFSDNLNTNMFLIGEITDKLEEGMSVQNR